jgi:hypothetical protein
LPRSWRKVSFTESPTKWKIRLHRGDGEQPSHHDLPWEFDSEDEAGEQIRRWKEADDDREVIEERKRTRDENEDEDDEDEDRD